MKIVRLWTQQGDGFDITSDTVVPEKSQYWGEFSRHYKRLYATLGDSQFIWCWTVEATGETKGEGVWWPLCVPSEKIIAYVVEHVWERIIGRLGLPYQIRDRLRNQAAHVAPGVGFHEEFERLEAAFWAEEAPSGDWWNHLVVTTPHEDGSSALVKLPVDASWIAGETCSERELYRRRMEGLRTGANRRRN